MSVQSSPLLFSALFLLIAHRKQKTFATNRDLYYRISHTITITTSTATKGNLGSRNQCNKTILTSPPPPHTYPLVPPHAYLSLYPRTLCIPFTPCSIKVCIQLVITIILIIHKKTITANDKNGRPSPRAQVGGRCQHQITGIVQRMQPVQGCYIPSHHDSVDSPSFR